MIDLANAADNDIPAQLEGIISKCGITETKVTIEFDTEIFNETNFKDINEEANGYDNLLTFMRHYI